MRGTKTKAIALGMLDYLIHENDQTFMLFCNFLTIEPLNEQYEGVEMLLGRGTFTQNIDDANVIEAFKEGRNQELKAGLRTIDERTITKRSNLSFFETRYQHLIALFSTLKGIKQEEEELLVSRNRLCAYLRRDLIDFGQEVSDEVDGYIVPSVIKDLLEQLSN